MEQKVLRIYMNQMCQEQSTKDRRTAIETLITIYRNLLKNEAKYKEIKLSNSTFQAKIKLWAAKQFLLHAGWKLDGDTMHFTESVDIKSIIELLLEYRNVPPVENEWVHETKHEGKSREQIREELLRLKAAEVRKKELEAFYKDKQERETIAKNVKAEHEADKHRRRYLTPQVGNQLQKGAKVKSLNTTID